MISEYSLEDIDGVGPATAKKLREAGYVTVESLAVATAFELSEANPALTIWPTATPAEHYNGLQ